MKELTEEQKKLADQMVNDIQTEIAADLKAGDPVMTGTTEDTPVKSDPNALVDGILEWGKTIDIDAITSNSVLLVKVNLDDPEYAHAFQMGVIKHVLEPRFRTLKEKKVTVLFMGSKDDISILTEKDMEKSGWVKKEPSRIITL